MNTNTFGDEPLGDPPLTRIADALEIHKLYLAYLNLAFGAGMVEMTLEELAEGEYE
jgi:hypothetical protein